MTFHIIGNITYLANAIYDPRQDATSFTPQFDEGLQTVEKSEVNSPHKRGKSRSWLARSTIILGCIAAITGCMTATPYQPEIAGQKASGGYSESRIADNRYKVNFAGNSLTSRDRVEGYLLYRAAELTVQNGYDVFVINDRLTERDVRTYVGPDPLYRPYYGSTYGYWRPHWRYYTQGSRWNYWHPEWGGSFWADRVDIRTVEKFEAHAEIEMLKGPVPSDNRRAFDARQVIQDLEPTIERL